MKFPWRLGERGIRVNAVAPGIVATDMSSFVKTEAGRDFAHSIQALKRVALASSKAWNIVLSRPSSPSMPRRIGETKAMINDLNAHPAPARPSPPTR